SVQLLVGRGVGIARGVTELQDGHTVALVTNFRQESQHLTKGTAVGYVEEIQNSAAIAVISEDASSTQHKRITPSELDIDPSLPAPKRRQLSDLLAEFRHLGYSRTLARIREKYYWPMLPKTVHLYTRSCYECQRRKKPPSKPAGLLQPTTPPTKPFQQIGMDVPGPFPPSTMGNRWIIVATDYLPRYAETKALPSGTAVEVAKFFIESIVLRHGAPEVLITDRGSSFMAQLTQEILRLSHTDYHRTTAYHPQTSGLTERLNKTIADMVSMYVDVEHETWDEVLPYVTFAYNTAVQETTGVPPFQLVYGRTVTTMLDSMLPQEPVDDGSDDAQVVPQRAKEVRQLARLRNQDQQHVDAGRYNLRRRDVHFQPGDRVWVWTPIRRRGFSEKLLERYFGPYKGPFCFTGWYHVSGTQIPFVIFYSSPQGAHSRVFHRAPLPFLGSWHKVVYTETRPGPVTVTISTDLEGLGASLSVALDDLSFQPGPCPS
ncbi:DDE-type integrase/transposase/recombinase, partial [Ixodes scapularis]